MVGRPSRDMRAELRLRGVTLPNQKENLSQSKGLGSNEEKSSKNDEGIEKYDRN